MLSQNKYRTALNNNKVILKKLKSKTFEKTVMSLIKSKLRKFSHKFHNFQIIV